MRTQIITALSIVAVLGAAGGAYAVNQSVLGTALVDETVIGSATPVLVPVEPKGDDIPEEYLKQIARAAQAEQPAAPVTPAQPVTTWVGSDDDDDHDEDEDEDSEHEDESEDDEHEDESDDDD
ncbi:hypothetical protein [Microcella humidisoli]|jgi:pyruvate/2-oxoacid:ferredoxin oxidoreductase alpha subunit|uniref:Small secreted hydrophilic protein n=1 Tax=Microcella humidisoli TaxID=2963406 RepID=A0ABY5FZD9_9MICO|nr:hypothetical protein [Microcella humidisoli]UTT63502.1 hypothetical protein NNL39_05215 [Microcella humidisoli]